MSYVFGYGSLVSPASAARSLGREVGELRAAHLRDYRRDWGIGVPVVFDDGTRATGAFLDVQADPGSVVLGALLRVSEDELRVLAAREAQYNTVDVTRAIAEEVDGSVYAFVGRAEHRAGDRMLPQRYIDLVAAAVSTRGEAYAAEFWATTEPADLPRRDGTYRFADPDQERATRP